MEFTGSSPTNQGLPKNDGLFVVDETFNEGYWKMTVAGGFSISAAAGIDIDVVAGGFGSLTLTENSRLLSRYSSGSDWLVNGIHANVLTDTVRRRGITLNTYEFAVGHVIECTPVFTSCPTDIVQDNDPGDCGAIVTWTAPEPEAICTALTVTSNFDPGDFFPVGMTEVVYYLWDGPTKVDSCKFDVEIIDNENPVANCKDITVTLDATGNASIGAADVDNGSIDNCGIASSTLDITDFTCADQGIVPVTLTVIDNSGNTSTCVSNVTVESSLDITAMSVQSCNAVPGIAALFDSEVGGGDGNYTYFWDGLDDSVDPFMTITLIPFSVSTSNTSTEENPLLSWFLADGTYEVTLTVTDGNGCTDIDTLIFTKDGLTTDNISVVYSSACEGSTVTYSVGYDADATYAWEVENGTIISAIPYTNEIDVAWDLAVTEGVVRTNITEPSLFGDCESSVIDSVTIHPIPTPAFVAPVATSKCLNATETYTLTNTYDSYSWTVTGGSIIAGGSASDNDVTVQWTSAGTGNVDVQVTTLEGCPNSVDADVVVYKVEGSDDSQTDESCPGASDGEVTVSATGGLGIHELSIDGGLNWETSPHTFTGLTEGNYTVIARDALGCTDNIPVSIVLADVTPPTVICQDINVYLDATGNASITAADVDNGSSDACGIQSMVIDISTFDCSDTGPNNVTLTVTDNSGNSDNCVAVATVIDTISPSLTCPGVINVECAGDVPAPYADYAALAADLGSAFDNCGIDVASLIHLGDVSDASTCPETITRTYQISDVNGNTATCDQSIIIEDITDPTASNPAPIDVECIGEVPAPDITVVTDEADNCGVVPVVAWESDASDGNTCPEVITRTYSVTDDCGNSINVTQTITILDITNPTLSAPTDISVECLSDVPADYANYVQWTAAGGTAGDNCGVNTASFTMVSETDDGNTCPKVITRIYQIEDNCGNIGTAAQSITVNDVTSPTLTSPSPLSFECGSDVDAPYVSLPAFEMAGGTAVDNCGIDNSSFTWISDVSDSNTCPETITRTYEVADNCGNASQVTQTITVNDVTDPTASDPSPITVDCSGDVPAPDVTVVDDEADNCTSAPVVAHVGDASDGNTCPETITRTYSVTDDCGNSINVTQTITVSDTQSPTATGSLDNTVIEGCDATDAPAAETTVAGLEGLDGTLDITDNCSADGDITVTHSDASAGTCPLVITRTYTLTDECGNTNTVVHTIEIDDTTAPVITGSLTDSNIEGCDATDAPAAVTTVAGLESLAGGLTVDDACSADGSITVTHSDASAGTCPLVITRTYTVTDECGNSDNIVHTIRVDDTTPPVLSLTPADVTVECDAVPAVAAITATDNCDGAVAINFSQTSTAGTCANNYTLTREWSATDACGNNTTHTQTITVEDTESPVVTGTFNLVSVEGCDAGDAPAAETTVSGLEGLPGGVSITDNCSADADITVTHSDASAGTCPVTITRTYILADECGNTTNVVQTIEIDDNTAPVISGSLTDSTVEGCDAGDAPAAETTVADLEALAGGITVDDACSADADITVSSSETSAGSCPVTVTRTYTLTDECGNSSTIDHIIIIDDNTVPTLTAPADITVECTGDVPAVYGSFAEWTTAGGTGDDNCSLDNSTFAFAGVTDDGNTCPKTLTRTYYIEDDCGNSITTTQDIIINDVTDPTASNPAPITVECSGDVPAPDISVVTDEADNCTAAPTVAFVVDVSDGNTCPEVITRTYSVTDDCGNSITVDQTITINDVTDPTASDPSPITVECSGDVPAPDVTVVDDEADNCTSAPVVAHVGDASDGNTCPETITRTYSVTDDCGNSINVTQTITVSDTQSPTATGSLDNTVIEGCDATDAPAAETTVAGLEGLDGTLDITDNCSADGDITVTHSDASAGTCPLVITRTYTLTDECGNTNTVVHTIEIDDTTAPVITGSLTDSNIEGCDATDAPAAVTTVAGLESLAGGLTVDDACSADGSITVTHSDASAGTCPLVITRTYTVTDECGNSDNIVHTIRVDDTTPPVLSLTPADVTVECDAVPAVAAITATDNCDGAVAINFSQTSTAGTCANNYTLTREWSATDACGNNTTHTQTITVEDTESPVVTGTFNLVSVEGCDAGDAPAAETTVSGLEGLPGGVSITDNCSADTDITVTHSDASAGTCPVTITRTYTLADECGNTTNVVQTIEIDDNTAPVITGSLTDLTVEGCDAGDAPAAETTVADLEALAGGITVDDACSADADITVSSSETSAGSCPVTVTRTYTLTDECGNSSTIDHIIIIDDNTVPTLTAPADITVECTGDVPAPYGNYVQWTAALGTASDNCGINTASFTVVSETDDGNACPKVITRLYQIEDNCGNVGTATQAITIDDITPPVLTSPAPLTFECASDVDAPYVSLPAFEMAGGTADDNCGIDASSFAWISDVSDINTCPETITRTYEVADNCGNASQVTQTITVNDVTSPTLDAVPGDLTAVCDISEQPAYADYAEFTAAGGNATDNCGIDASSFTLFDESSDGVSCPEVVTRTYRIADDCGNTVDYVQTITIDDDTSPTFDAVPGDLTAECDISEQPAYADYAEFTAAGGNATDNCGIDVSSFTLFDESSDGGSCPEVVTRTYRIADDCGNTVDYIQTITIDDDTSPTFDAVPGDLTAECDISEQPAYADYAEFTAAGGNATDNCGIDVSSFTLFDESSDGGSCPEVVTRTYRIADDCGNTADYIQTITIDDGTSPSFDAVPGDLTAECDISEQPAYADYAEFTAAGGNATDNCGIDASSFILVSEVSDAGSCPEIVTRTYRIADDCGNTVDYVQTITIDDGTSPSFDAVPGDLTAVCDISEQPAYADYAEFTAAGGNATDNCGIDASSFTLFDESSDGVSCPEVVTRTYRIADDCGNTADYIQTITIDDDINPIFDAVPGDLTAVCDISEQPAYADYAEFTAAGGNATDNCGIDASSFTLFDESSDGVSCPEVVTRTYRIADDCGNTADYIQTITIDDGINPIALTQCLVI
ncbi:MAG: HYR domain-containing protein [Bacteroidales bacterium]|nr:HYR domain-containing protein [Bacteroidales bacterium]